MYLTKYSIDISHPSSRQNLRDCNDMHKTVMSLFENQIETSPRASLKILYRIKDENNKKALYLISKEKPNCSPKTKGLVPLGTKDILTLKSIMVKDKILNFDMLVVPSKKVKSPDSKNSKRKTLNTYEERSAWLKNKANQNGFEVLSVMEKQQIPIESKTLTSNRIIYKAVNMLGVLKITDKNKFLKAFYEGIGPGKAFGLGMIMLTPYRG